MQATGLRSAVLMVSVLALGSPAWAQHADPKPSHQPAHKQPDSPDAKGSDKGKQPAYPEVVKNKKLYAAKDVRGQKAPDFKVEKWLTEEPKREGKTVLIDFWATWCPPCRALIPELNGYQKTFKDDLVVIGVSDEDPAKVEKFMKGAHFDYAVATDTKGVMKKKLGIEGIPHVLLISSDGVVRWQGFPGSSEDQLTEEKVRQVIEADKAARAKKTEKAHHTEKPKASEKSKDSEKPASPDHKKP